MKLETKPETKSDYLAIKNVNDLAFGSSAEGILVEKLRLNPDFIPELSIVAVLNGKIVGHILFFPIRIKGGSASYNSLALAPMSVLPGYQKKGIGGQLIKNGLAFAGKLGFKSVIVLGHADYYPRYGFSPASKWKITSPFDVPDEVFMAIELVPHGLKNVSGIVEYPAEFKEVS